MKKLLALCALTGCAFAYQGAPSSLEERVSHLELTTSMETCGARVPDAQKDTTNNFILSFDVIYWQPRTDLTEFGTSWAENEPLLTRYRNMSSKYHKFDMEFGFKVGLGYHFDTSSWDLNAQYTYITFDDTELATANTGIVYQPTPWSPLTIVNAAYPSMKSTYAIDYQTVDLVLSKGFFVNKCTSLTPFYGVKASWINHSPTILSAIVNIDEISVSVGDENTHVTEKTRAIGPTGGFDFNWFFCDGWSIYTKAGSALLFTSYRGTVKTVGFYDGDVYSEREFGLKESKQYICANLFLALGLSYQHYFEENGSCLNLHAGYESQYYINQSYKLANPDPNRAQGIATGAQNPRNLGLMGLTAGATFDF